MWSTTTVEGKWCGFRLSAIRSSSWRGSSSTTWSSLLLVTENSATGCLRSVTVFYRLSVLTQELSGSCTRGHNSEFLQLFLTTMGRFGSPRIVAPGSYHLPTMGRSPGWPKGPRQASTVQPSNTPLPLRSRSHNPELGSNTPIRTWPVPVQSPATGRSPEMPKGPRQPSTVHPSQAPLPLRSSCHCPVPAVKSPSLVVPVPVQSPTTGRPLRLPKAQQPSTVQPSLSPLPLRSSCQE